MSNNEDQWKAAYDKQLMELSIWEYELAQLKTTISTYNQAIGESKLWFKHNAMSLGPRKRAEAQFTISNAEKNIDKMATTLEQIKARIDVCKRAIKEYEDYHGTTVVSQPD